MLLFSVMAPEKVTALLPVVETPPNVVPLP